MTPPILHANGDDPRSFILDEATTIDDLTAYLEARGAKTIQPKTGSLFVCSWLVSTAGEKQFNRSSILLFPDNHISVLGPIVDDLAALVVEVCE